MLSETSDKTPMAYPNYSATCWGHRVCLISVSAVGSAMSGQKFRRIFDDISQVKKVNPVTTSSTKTGSATFYHPENNEQDINEPSESTFRVAFVENYPVENNEWGEFQKHRQVLGLISVGAFSSEAELSEARTMHELNASKYSASFLDSRLILIRLKGGGDIEEVDEANILYYEETDGQERIREDIEDFCTGLFWILESKRVEEAQRDSKVPLLSTPFEKKDFVGLDLETRANKKRTFGRHRKSLGDLCLLCDRTVEAYRHYEVAAETLKSCNDWIWLSSALEGICAISTMVTYPDPSTGVVEPIRWVPDQLNLLKPRDIVEKYKEIVIHYTKYRQAAVIETEASVKAVHVLTEQKNFLVAAEFLQNLTFINLNMNETEKIHRFAALSRLYHKIGFKRKGAFFLRVAAMRCVAPQNPHPDWQLCYSLLMEANFGYSLNLGKQETKRCGWPALQIQLMQELVSTSRRMGHYNVAVVHLTHLMEEMFQFLSQIEMIDIVKQLNTLVPQIHDISSLQQPISIMRDSEEILLKFPGLQKVPTVTSFQLSPLPGYLTPKTSAKKDQGCGVFFFTPKQFGGSRDEGNKVPFSWVQDDVAEVCLMLSNPIPTEVKIVNLVLTCEGPKFEAFPSTFSLTNTNEKIPISLVGIPKEPGLLTITGYSCTVLGVPSSCTLGKLSGNFPSDGYVVEVVPRLPLLQGVIAKKEENDEISEIHIMHGEEVQLEILLTNASQSEIQVRNISWTSSPSITNDICKLDIPRHLSLPVRGTDKVGVVVTGKDMAMSKDKSGSLDSRKVSRLDEQFNSINLNDKACDEPVDETVYEFEFKISYSSSDKCDYYRELVKVLKVFMSPSAVVTWWDVLPSETLNKNYLVLDIENCTSTEVEICYDPGKSLVMEPSDNCRIPLPIERFKIPTHGDHVERVEACMQHLKQTAKVEWRTHGEPPRFGKVLFDNLHLTNEMVINLELLPTRWEIQVNGNPLTNSNELGTDFLKGNIGDAIDLSLKLSSGFAQELVGKFYVDINVHGIKDFDMENVCVQSLRESSELSCAPNDSIIFNTVILPLVEGKLDINCSCAITCNGLKMSSKHISKFPTFTYDVKMA